MELDQLKRDTTAQVNVARDAGGDVGRLRKELQEAVERWKDAESGAEARRLLEGWKTATIEAGLRIPGDLSHVPLDAVAQLQAPLALKQNDEKYQRADAQRANSKPEIKASGKYTLRTEVTSYGRKFAKYSIIDAAELPPGVLTLLVSQGKAVATREPERATA